MMREEMFWMDHPEHWDFYSYWDEYHGQEHCEGDWYDFDCSAFGDDSGCRIEVHWADCDAGMFECSVRREDDNGNAEDCSRNFKDTEFWNGIRDVQELQDSQYESFMNYWRTFHENGPCSWDCEETDCADAFGLDFCNERSCFNTCDDDWHCRVEYVWE